MVDQMGIRSKQMWRYTGKTGTMDKRGMKGMKDRGISAQTTMRYRQTKTPCSPPSEL
jgi:hypothetical protein